MSEPIPMMALDSAPYRRGDDDPVPESETRAPAIDS
jgi:hypothetical protein